MNVKNPTGKRTRPFVFLFQADEVFQIKILLLSTIVEDVEK